MAFVQQTLKMYIDIINMVLSAHPSCKIFEFGDQIFMDNPAMPVSRHIKNLYKDKISQYISLDLNGKNDSQKGDMREDLSRFGYGSFDIVTNMGTSEHVQIFDKQYECFKNTHDLCKLNGYIIHEIPFDKVIESAWGRHSPAYYAEDFFRELKRLNKYEEVRFDAPDGDIGPPACGGHILVFYRKTTAEFIPRDLFPYAHINWEENRGESGDYA